MPSYTRKVRKVRKVRKIRNARNARNATKVRTARNARNATKVKPQKGGYYFSVYHGVQNASLLLPLAFRQAHQLLSGTRKSKSKTRNKK